jgi:hypothetical protein
MSSSYLLSWVVAFGLFSSGCSAPTYSVRPASVNAIAGPGARVVVVVRVPIPWYAPRFVVRGKFRDVLAEYEPLAALEAKYFTISDDGQYGGVYLWSTREAADRHFDAAWRAGVKARRGVDADVLFLDAPYVIEGRAIPKGKTVGSRSVEYPAWVSMVRWNLASGADSASAAKTLAAWLPSDSLIRSFVVTSPESVGVVSLWASREAAENAASAEARAATGNAIAATASTFTLFEAPLLVDATIRGASASRLFR